jgi:hypothetical protein
VSALSGSRLVAAVSLSHQSLRNDRGGGSSAGSYSVWCDDAETGRLVWWSRWVLGVRMASVGQAAARSTGSKRRIPLGLLPYSSSESEEEDDASEAPQDDAPQLGGLMMRQRAAANTCASGASENGLPSQAAHDKRRKVATLVGQCKSSPLRASVRMRQSPVREGMVDITQKGLSFAHSGSAQGTKQATAERSGTFAASTSQPKHGTPAASAASANGEEVSRALRLDSTASSDTGAGTPGTARSGPGPQTPLGAPPAPGLALTDSRLPAPGRDASSKPCPPSAMKSRRASDSVAGRTARASVTWRDDVVSPPASRVRLHKEARRQSEDMLADAEASDLADRFSEVAEQKPPSPAQTRRRASEKAANAHRSSGCTDRRR